MIYRWRYEKTDGTPVPGPDLAFDDQLEAEEWFGGEWETLAEEGVQQVVLLRGEPGTDTGGPDTEVYGPMLLSE